MKNNFVSFYNTLSKVQKQWLYHNEDKNFLENGKILNFIKKRIQKKKKNNFNFFVKLIFIRKIIFFFLRRFFKFKNQNSTFKKKQNIIKKINLDIQRLKKFT